MSLNRVVLMGRIANNLELRQTQSGIPVMSFSIAVNRENLSKEAEKKADFIDCTAWRGTAEFISRNFQKGKLIVVEGSLQTEDWTDKNGNKRKSTKVSVQNVYFCGDKSIHDNQNQTTQANTTSIFSMGYFDDITADDYYLPEEFKGDGDLPF